MNDSAEQVGSSKPVIARVRIYFWPKTEYMLGDPGERFITVFEDIVYELVETLTGMGYECMIEDL